MPKSRTSRSLFSSLPIDLKKSLRSQTVEPYTLAPRLDSVQVKAELIADTVQFGPLLHTQPQSPGVSPDAAEIVDLTEEPAESSTSAALRTKRPENVLTSPRSAKERRGKEKVPANPHQGHAWDCTGLVPRFSDYSQLPQQLAKCALHSCCILLL